MEAIAHNKQLVPFEPGKLNCLKVFLRSPLGLALVAGYLVVVLCFILYVTSPDKYASDLSLVLPTAGSSSKVTLEEVGQVSQSSASAFGNQAYSPLSTYKQILTGSAVIQQAANILGIDPTGFGSPRVKAVQQTSILQIRLSAHDAESSNQKAWALIEAFQLELDRLRFDEAKREDESVERALASHQERLNKARMAIVDFQQRSLLISTEQMDLTVLTLAKVREDLTFSKSEKASTEKFMRRLSSHLGVSPELAGYALALQSDTQFAAYLNELQDSAAQLSRFQSQWGQSHPKVLTEQQRFNGVLALLQERSADVVGVSSSRVLHEMNLSSAAKLAELFSNLLDAGANLSGQEAKIRELQQAELRIDDQLRVYAREYAELERLEREHQRAEAIYNAAAARLEQGKTDRFSSYPIVQVLATPSSSGNSYFPSTKLAIAIAIAALILLHIGIWALWQRDRLIDLLLKRR